MAIDERQLVLPGFEAAFESPAWIRKIPGWVYSSHPDAVDFRLRYWYRFSFWEKEKARYRERYRRMMSNPEKAARYRAHKREYKRRRRAASSGG